MSGLLRLHKKMALALRQVEAIPNVEVHNDKPYKFNPNLSIKREQLLEVSSHNTYVGILSQVQKN